MLTQERLKELVTYFPTTGEMTWNVDRSRNKAGSRVGHRTQKGYVLVGIDKKLYLRHRLAWLYVNGVWPTAFIDHVNGIKGDDRLENLREAEHSQNIANSKRHTDNKSGVKGVHFHPQTGKWRVQLGGKATRHVGLFESKAEAADAYEKAARERWGKYARSD